MIKLIDLLIEQWDTKTMGKPLSKSEITALKKKLNSPEVRKGLKSSETQGKYPNFWSVPMGGVEKGETFEEGAARELKEETMLDINPKSLVYLGTIKDGVYNRLCKVYKAEMDGKPEPTLDHEHTDWGYYDKDSLPRPFEDRMRQVLELNL